MTDQPHEDVYDDVPDDLADEIADEREPVLDDAPAESVTETGHPAVDEVLRSLESLGDAPVDDHVAVFEQAHDRLRRTLAGAGDDQD